MEWSLGRMETRFAELIWEAAPIPSGELVKLCEKELEWKKSTTYTMLRRLCQKGIFENKNGMVCTVLTREEVQSRQSQEFLQENFQGSIPRFLLAAFSARSPLTEAEIAELEQLIRQGGKGGEEKS